MKNVTTVLPFLKEGLEEDPARALYPSGDMVAPAQGDQLRFTSDEEGPNAAWVWSHHNKVEFWYFEWILEGFREWAYVMSDSKRLNHWVALRSDADSLAEAQPQIKTADGI